MIYLILAIASSACVSLFIRGSEKKVTNNMAMFSANYLTCILLARLFMGEVKLYSKETGVKAAIIIGAMTGVLFLASFVLLQFNIKKNGVVMSSVFAKLGVIIPTLMAMVIFGEKPKALQLIGILIAVFAVVMINLEKGASEGKKSLLWLIVLLVVGGAADAMTNVYDKLGASEFKDHFLFYTFFVALICSLILLVAGRKGISLWDVLFGVLVGIPNYFSARFILHALGSVPAVMVYPVYSVATIAVLSLVSVLLFKEKLGRRKLVAIGMILVALVFLNI